MSADGERLDISSNVIIESYQISCFSPRDLSNLSLIYCSNVDSFWYGICSSWLSMHKEKYKCMPEFETFVNKLIAWLFPSMIANFRCSKLPHQEVYATLEIFSGLLEQIDTLELTNPNLKKGGKKKTRKHMLNKMHQTSPKQSSRPCLYGLLYGDSVVNTKIRM